MQKRWIGGVIAGLLALSLAGAAPAQETTKPAKKPGAAGKPAKKGGGAGVRRYREILAKLNLTPDQKTKVDALVKDLREDMKKLRQAPGTPQEKRPQMQARNKEFREALNKILTPAQQATLKEEMAKARKAGKKKDGAKPAAGAKPAPTKPTKG